jgi:NADPH2:quinone reductase
VRIRVSVSGVNPTDWKSRSGAFGRSPAEPTVANHDGAGIVDAVGPGVAHMRVGDRVWVTLAADGRPASGTAQEYTVVPAERAFPLPAGADFELGASLGIPGATAHRALTVAENGPTRLQPGALRDRTVLVAGGAGAVGNAAIQLARWAGATVIATTSTGAKADWPVERAPTTSSTTATPARPTRSGRSLRREWTSSSRSRRAPTPAWTRPC